MNKFIITFLLILFTSNVMTASDGSHSFYLSNTLNLEIENSVFLYLKNPDYEAWSSPYNKFSWEGGYSYGLNNFLSVGIQLEEETVKFDNYSIGKNATAKKIAAGIHFEASFPEKPLHLIGGGFLNYGKAKSDDFDFKLGGLEYGIYLGPEVDIQKIKASLCIKPRFGYFTSGGENTESLLLLYPGLALRLKYEF